MGITSERLAAAAAAVGERLLTTAILVAAAVLALHLLVLLIGTWKLKPHQRLTKLVISGLLASMVLSAPFQFEGDLNAAFKEEGVEGAVEINWATGETVLVMLALMVLIYLLMRVSAKTDRKQMIIDSYPELLDKAKSHGDNAPEMLSQFLNSMDDSRSNA